MGCSYLTMTAGAPEPLDVIKEFVKSSGRLAVVCLGNELRGDDIAGKIVCDRLAELCDEKLYIVYAGQDAARVIGLALEGYNVLVVDAVICRKGQVGDIVIASVEDLGEDSDLLSSTHTLSIGRFASYIRSKLLIVGINVDPKRLGLGAPVSGDVVRAAHALADLLASILHCRE